MTKTCTIDGCDQAHCAKGLCKRHYRNHHRAEVGREPTRRIEVPCAVCETPIMRRATDLKVRKPTCSTLCRQVLTFGSAQSDLPPDHWARWYGATSPWSPPERQTRFVSVECADCAAWFIEDRQGHGGAECLYCSERCTGRSARRRKRARRFGATGTFRTADVERISQAAGARCAYCRERVDEVEPDHFIALSRGGSNRLSNILPACHLCNSDKHDMTIAEWNVDRDRRGLDRIDFDPDRYPHLTPERALGEPLRVALLATA